MWTLECYWKPIEAAETLGSVGTRPRARRQEEEEAGTTKGGLFFDRERGGTKAVRKEKSVARATARSWKDM